MNWLYKIGITISLSWGLYFVWTKIYRFIWQRKYKGDVEVRNTVKDLLEKIHQRKWTKDTWRELGDAISYPRYFEEVGESGNLGNDCVTIDTKIILQNKKGEYVIKSLEEIRENFFDYKALSYNFQEQKFEFKEILSWMDKGIKDIYEVTLAHGHKIKATKEHKFFVWNKDRVVIKKLEELDKFCNAEKRSFEQILCAKKIPELNINDEVFITKDIKAESRIYGLYLAEGWSSGVANKTQTNIANDNKLVQKQIKDDLTAMGERFKQSKRETHAYINIHKSKFSSSLPTWGKNSTTKHILPEFKSVSSCLLEEMINSYAVGDAWINNFQNKHHKYAKLIHNTSSDSLAEDLKFIYLRLGKPLSSQFVKNHGGVGNNPMWRLQESSGKMYKDKITNVIGKGARSVNNIGEGPVCDITIKDNGNFVLWNGIIAHNCDDFSIWALNAGREGFSVGEDIYMPEGLFTVTWNTGKGLSGHNVALFKCMTPGGGVTLAHLSNWGFMKYPNATYEFVAKDIAIGFGKLAAWRLTSEDLKKKIAYRNYL